METETTVYNGPNYFTNVYHDILDDDYCLWTIYRFVRKDVALKFIEEVPFVCSEIEYDDKPRTDDEHVKTNPFRPIFETLEDAIEDAKDFHKHGKNEEYKYSGRVFEVELTNMETQYHKNMIRSLKNENDELRERVIFLETQIKTK